MAVSKEQKTQIVEEGKKDIGESQILLFADFRGTKVSEMSELRRALREVGIKFRVIKKRLIKVMLKEKGIEFDPVKLDGQIGAAFAKGDISEVAGPVYRFSKEHETFRIVGGIDVEKKEEIPLETIVAIGQLPPRETLLAQVVGSIAAPLRGFMYVLKAKSEK